MSKLIDLTTYPIRNVLSILLQDKTTKKNIIWATDIYANNGKGFQDRDQITLMSVIGLDQIALQSRNEKAADEQQTRTRKKAEVFTPVWLCNKMNNFLDEQWFEHKNVFNIEDQNYTWNAINEKVIFPAKKTWKQYVDMRCLEVACGEAPYLVSRYDVTTGMLISQKYRIGLLDRKLRIVNENESDDVEWTKWVCRAFQSCYGYEYQGDNLLIARINLFMTFYDYYYERIGKEPKDKLLKKIANIIAWNVWQMDGLKDTVPLGKPHEEFHQLSIFDMDNEDERTEEEAPLCKIQNWRSKKKSTIRDLKEGKGNGMGKKLFDVIIGNPPYQDETLGDNKGFAPPVYNKFLDEAYKIADVVEMIHPARFLFNAGSTPKAWNEKMLKDEHFKVLSYESDASKIFPNTDIKGGVIISYHNDKKIFGAIKVFTKYPELNLILSKVNQVSSFLSMSTIVVTRTAYRLTDKMHKDHPEAIGQLSKGHAYDMSTNIFERLPQIFYTEKPQDELEYIRILGREKNERVYKYIRRDYVNQVINLDKFKIFIPKANGIGKFGEILSLPIISEPGIGSTETFLSIGSFNTEYEVNVACKYIKTKFVRALLGILKTTQDITPEKWKYVPMQNFTPNSDIDWSQTIQDIDRQLYAKYKLSQEEINFIENTVKEMQ